MTSLGEVLNGRYRLEERLGEGSMGSVWKAHDLILERPVAVKELISQRYGAEALTIRRERVRREALALAKVEHPAIVVIHDLIYEGKKRDPWIVMGYVRGRPLDQLIRQSATPLSEQEVASIGLRVLEGLMACHQCDVYHRDVKPANIVVAGDGAVRLVDFGIVAILGEDPLTAVGNVPGTPEFLAPEILSSKPAGPATDLWALAVTLYNALTGNAPFRAETIAATFAAILSRNPPEPRGGGPLGDLVIQMLRKQPDERPDSATVATVLRDIADGPGSRREQPRTDGAAGWHGAAQQTGPRGQWRQLATGNGAIRPARPRGRLTPLSGMPVLDRVKVVADWPTDRAAAELLALEVTEAANVINRSGNAAGGRLLSAIGGQEPGMAWKILDMLPPKRAGELLDHMSSVASAAVLALPSAASAVRVLDRADPMTVVGVLSEMPPAGAASVVLAMDLGRAVEVLRQAAPVKTAPILRGISSGSERRALLNGLPERLRAVVIRLLQSSQ